MTLRTGRDGGLTRSEYSGCLILQLTSPDEYKLVAAPSTETSLDLGEREATLSVVIDDDVRRRHFERVASAPVNEIMPKAHPARLLIFGPPSRV